MIETNGGILWDKEIHELFLYHERERKRKRKQEQPLRKGSEISISLYLSCDLEIVETFNFIALISNNFVEVLNIYKH